LTLKGSVFEVSSCTGPKSSAPDERVRVGCASRSWGRPQLQPEPAIASAVASATGRARTDSAVYPLREVHVVHRRPGADRLGVVGAGAYLDVHLAQVDRGGVGGEDREEAAGRHFPVEGAPGFASA